MLADLGTGPFTISQVMASGATRGQVRAALRAGRWQRLWAGVYAHAALEPTLAARAVGLRLRYPAAVVSHGSAAALHRFCVLGEQEAGAPLHVTLPPGHPPVRRPGLVVHRRVLERAETAQLRGLLVHRRPRQRAAVATLPLAVTDAYRTSLDLACSLPRLEAVMSVDSALHHERCEREHLLWRFSLLPPGRGRGRARQVLALCRHGAQSPQETRLRLLAHDAGLPEPVLQLPIATAGGVVRADLGWPAARVAAEYDGFAPHSGRTQFVRDRRRWRWLRESGWEVLPYTFEDLVGDPARVAAELRAAILR